MLLARNNFVEGHFIEQKKSEPPARSYSNKLNSFIL
jgi:hypothetical protein